MELQRSPSTVVGNTESSLLEMEVVSLQEDASVSAGTPVSPTPGGDVHSDLSTDLFTYRYKRYFYIKYLRT